LEEAKNGIELVLFFREWLLMIQVIKYKLNLDVV